MNNPKEVKRMVQYIRNSYGKTQLPDQVLTFITEQIRHIPTEAVAWIQDEVIRANPQRCPDVMHLAILAGYYAWRAAHPEKCAREPGEIVGCKNENCYDGFLILWERGKEDVLIRCFAVACADCKRKMKAPSSLRGITMAQALAKGFEPDSLAMHAEYHESWSELREENLQQYAASGRRTVREMRVA
jgi:hypothetical protein